MTMTRLLGVAALVAGPGAASAFMTPRPRAQHLLVGGGHGGIDFTTQLSAAGPSAGLPDGRTKKEVELAKFRDLPKVDLLSKLRLETRKSRQRRETLEEVIARVEVERINIEKTLVFSDTALKEKQKALVELKERQGKFEGDLAAETKKLKAKEAEVVVEKAKVDEQRLAKEAELKLQKDARLKELDAEKSVKLKELEAEKAKLEAPYKAKLKEIEDKQKASAKEFEDQKKLAEDKIKAEAMKLEAAQKGEKTKLDASQLAERKKLEDLQKSLEEKRAKLAADAKAVESDIAKKKEEIKLKQTQLNMEVEKTEKDIKKKKEDLKQKQNVLVAKKEELSKNMMVGFGEMMKDPDIALATGITAAVTTAAGVAYMRKKMSERDEVRYDQQFDRGFGQQQGFGGLMDNFANSASSGFTDTATSGGFAANGANQPFSSNNGRSQPFSGSNNNTGKKQGWNVDGSNPDYSRNERNYSTQTAQNSRNLNQRAAANNNSGSGRSPFSGVADRNSNQRTTPSSNSGSGTNPFSAIADRVRGMPDNEAEMRRQNEAYRPVQVGQDTTPTRRQEQPSQRAQQQEDLSRYRSPPDSRQYGQEPAAPRTGFFQNQQQGTTNNNYNQNQQQERAPRRAPRARTPTIASQRAAAQQQSDSRGGLFQRDNQNQSSDNRGGLFQRDNQNQSSDNRGGLFNNNQRNNVYSSFNPGDRVDTPYGPGTIQDTRPKQGIVIVNFDQGTQTGYVEESSVKALVNGDANAVVNGESRFL